MQKYFSRKQNIESRRNKKKAFWMLFLTILFIFIFIKFGIPLLVKYINFLSGFSNSGKDIDLTDTTPPPPPIVNFLAEYTNQKNIKLSGSTEEGSSVILTINGNTLETTADKSGSFSFSIELEEGENIIKVISKDTSGNTSKSTEVGEIIFDITPPDLTIETPSDRNHYYGSKEQNITISGKTESNCKVAVNGRHAIVSNDGSFSLSYPLSEGENILLITSEDKAQNKTEKRIIALYSS